MDEAGQGDAEEDDGTGEEADEAFGFHGRYNDIII